MDEQISRADVVATAASLRAVLDAIDAGELDCPQGLRARIRGAAVALDALARLPTEQDHPDQR